MKITKPRSGLTTPRELQHQTSRKVKNLHKKKKLLAPVASPREREAQACGEAAAELARFTLGSVRAQGDDDTGSHNPGAVFDNMSSDSRAQYTSCTDIGVITNLKNDGRNDTRY